jgi:hypothetical protein
MEQCHPVAEQCASAQLQQVMEINMKRAITSIALLLSLSSTAIAGGGSDLPNHPLVDQHKGKQEAKTAAVVPATGAIVVTGFQSLANDGNDDIYTVKYAADGSIIWRAALDVSGGSDQGTAVVIDKNGDAIVAATVTTAGGYDIRLLRYRDNGATGIPSVVWTGNWSGTAAAADIAQALAYDPVMDRVYLAGYTNNGSNDDYLLIAFDNTLTGENPPLWTRTFDGGGKDRAFAVAVSADGSTIAVSGESSNGTDQDMTTVMWQADGTRIGVWPKGGTGSFNDRGTALAFTPTGNLIVAGYLTNGRGGDIYTAELSPVSNTPVWEKTYDGGFDDQPVAVGVDASGDVYVAATVGILPAFSKLFAVKYHKNGTTAPDTVWSTTFDAGSVQASGAVSLAIDSSSGIFLAGWRDYAGVKKVVTMKMSRKNGRILWDREWGGIIGNSSLPVAIGLAGQNIAVGGWTDRTQPLDGGTYAATGGSKTSLQNSNKSWTPGQWEGYSLYMASSQNKDVFRRIQGNDATTLFLAPAEALPYAVVAGNLYYIYDKDDIDLLVLRQEKGILDPPTGLSTEVLSSSSVRLTFQDNSETETTFLVDIKIGENGAWTTNAYSITTPDQPGMNTVSHVISGLLADTQYYFRVRAFDNTTYSDYSTEAAALTRIVNFFPPALTYVYGDPAGGDDLATDAACYWGGNVVVTGTVFSDQNGISTPSKDYFTIKLNRTDFAVNWKDQRDGGYDEDDEIVALAVDQNRETIVTGTSMQNVPGVGNIPSVWTLKYALSPVIDGLGEAEPVWTDQLNSSGRLADQSDVVAVQGVSPYWIAVAGHGNADLSNINFFVRKLSATGAVQFTTEKDLGGNEYPAAVAVDTAGNVIVAGRVEKNGGNSWFTAKFEAVGGTMVWSDIYGDTGDNRALSLTIDANNDVYVSGYTTDSATGYTRMTTIKYWGAANGTADRRWTRNYPVDTPAASFAARKIAYDPVANAIVVAGDGYTYVTDRDLAILRYDTAGNLLKQTELRNPGSDDILTGLSIDPSGYVYLAGDSGASPNTDIMGAIYTDSLEYVKSFLYQGSAGKNDHAATIAVNRFGEGFVAGYTTSAGGDKDFTALKIVNDLAIMPFGATATPQADFSRVALSWSNVTSGATPYVLRSIKDSNVWVAPPGTTEGRLMADATTSTDTGLSQDTTYCWRIYTALNSVTTRHMEVCATTTLAPPVISSAANRTKTSARIQWSNTVGNTGYRLERKTDTGGAWQTVATLPANTVYYDDPGLTAGTTFYYRLSAQNISGFSLPSPEFMVSTMPDEITWGWIDHYATSSTAVTIRPYQSTSPVSYYRVERKTGSGGTWSTAGSAGTFPIFNDSNLTPNTTYYYRYFSVYLDLENPVPSAEVAVTTWLNPPTLLSATAPTNTSVSGTWAQVVGNMGYELYARACTGSVSQILANPNFYCSSWNTAVVLPADITTGTITVPKENRAYQLFLSVKNLGGYSASSNMLVAFLPLSVSLTNVDIPAANQLRPVWTDTTEEYFDVQRRLPPDTTWATIRSALPANTLSWTDTTVSNGTQYCYRTRAYTSAGGPADAFSGESCQTAQAPPAAPSMSLSTPAPTTVRFDWNNTSYPAAATFDLYTQSYDYSSGGLPETNAGSWSPATFLTTVNCTTASCSYTYTPARGTGMKGLARINFYGTVIDSQTVSPPDGYVQTVPNPPAVSSITVTDTTATVKFNRINGAYGYAIYYKQTTDSTWSGPIRAPFESTPAPLTLTGLLPATAYQLRVESTGRTAESTDATIQNLLTLCRAPAITSFSNVTATGATITWESSAGAATYKLERSTDSATWTMVTTQNVLSYPDSGLSAGGTYWYRVKAVNGSGDSAPSAAVKLVTVPTTPEDPMPRQLSDTAMALSFRLVKGADAYKIYRRDGGPGMGQNYIKTAVFTYAEDFCGSAYPTISCAAPKALTAVVTDEGLQPDTIYCYGLAASNTNGDSAIGQELCGRTSAMGAPTVTATAQNPFVTNLSWTPGAATVAIDGHVVETVEKDGTTRTLAFVPMPTQTFTDHGGLVPGAPRTYRVRPYRRFYDDFSSGLSLTDWAPWGRHRHGDGNEDFTIPPVDATDIDGRVRISWDPSGKAELYTQVPGGITVNSYNFAQIGLNRLDLFTGDFDINYDFTIDIPNAIPDTMGAYNVYNRLRIFFPYSSGGTLRNDVGFGYNNTASGPYFDSFNFIRGANTTLGPFHPAEKLQANGIKASRRGDTIQYYRKADSGWSMTTSVTGMSTTTPDYVWLVTFNNRTNPAPMEIRTLIDNVEVISYGTASAPATVVMPAFDGSKNYCP